VAAQDEKEHDEIMAKLLERAKAENVKFNPEKLQYKIKEVKYMGNIVSESGLKPDSGKVRAILDMPLPKSKAELRRFLGMVNFFSKIFPGQSSITDPQRQLLKKDSVWDWSHEYTGAVEQLKQILSSQPVLIFFIQQSQSSCKLMLRKVASQLAFYKTDIPLHMHPGHWALLRRTTHKLKRS
jgi:hypothetical protein